MEALNQKWVDLFGDEWPYIYRLSCSYSDPDEKKTFLDNVKERKLADKNFSIYELFPKADSMQICRDILKALKAVNEKHQEKAKLWTPKREKKREMMSRLLGELILQGFHNPPKESA